MLLCLLSLIPLSFLLLPLPHLLPLLIRPLPILVLLILRYEIRQLLLFIPHLRLVLPLQQLVRLNRKHLAVRIS